MTRRQAKKLINELKSEVNETTIRQQFWMDKVQAYTQTIFGNGDQSVAILMFGGMYFSERPYDGWTTTQTTNNIAKLHSLFDVYLKMIENKVYIKHNIFSESTNAAIVGWAIFFVGTISGWSYVEGARSANYKEVILESRNQKTMDSLSTFKNLSDKYKHKYDSCRTKQ